MSGKKTAMDAVLYFLFGVYIGITIYAIVHIIFPYEPLTDSEMETLKTIYPELYERLLISRLDAIDHEVLLYSITAFLAFIAMMVTAVISALGDIDE